MIIWKGRYRNIEQLPVGNLPDNAVKFNEPETFLKLNLLAIIFVIPVFCIVGISYYLKTLSGLTVDFFGMFNITGFLISVMMLVPHEILHAIAFPKQAEVQIWYSIKNMLMFSYSSYPTSKLRFIYSSLLPSFIFGFIPLAIWMFIPNELTEVSETIFSFAFFSLVLCVGDFLNVLNAATQMPKNSVAQLSGMHSYWYLK
ncbi:MAG: DUF3267 domain-containing protein [Clostridiaceae bacterium]